MSEWISANEKQPDIGSEVLYYSMENGVGLGLVKAIDYDFVNDDGNSYKLLLIYDPNDDGEFITSAEYWISIPQPPQA